MKKFLAIAFPVLVLAILLAGVFLPAPMTIEVSGGGISLRLSAAMAAEPPTLDIVFEPSGTHIKNGYLKIRLDFYPDIGDKSYESQHVYVPDETSPEYLVGYQGKLDDEGNPVDFEDYQHWLDSLPHVWRTNPCLCHFVTVPSTITKAQLETYINTTFHADVTATIDDVMSKADSAHLISPFMRNKAVVQKVIVPPLSDPSQLINDVNARLAGFTTGGLGGGAVIPIEPKSIDVGPGAIDRPSLASDNATRCDKANPANADGTLDTWEFWFDEVTTTCQCATFYVVSGDNLSTRDTENIGSVSADSKQTFTGLSTDVVTGDYAGHYYANGKIDRSDSGGAGVWSISGDYIPCTNQAITFYAGYATSVYATGTEASGEPDISNTPSSKAFGILRLNSINWSNGSTPDFPLDEGDCYFTLSNVGSAAVDLTANVTDPTGGTGATCVDSTPGADQVRVSLFAEGDGSTDNTTIVSGTPRAFYSDLAASANVSWEVRLEVGTSTETPPTSKSFTIKIIAAAS